MSVQLWFQFGNLRQDIRKTGRRFIVPKEIIEKFSLSVPVESLILKAKRISESEYTVLDSVYLCNNTFKSLSEMFDIAWGNPQVCSYVYFYFSV